MAAKSSVIDYILNYLFIVPLERSKSECSPALCYQTLVDGRLYEDQWSILSIFYLRILSKKVFFAAFSTYM